MDALLFILVLGLILGLILFWSMRHLPGERWQFLATVPVHKGDDGQWRGVNFTWYGLLNANATALGVAVMFVLMASIGVPTMATVAVAAGVLSVCVPAARLVAMALEGKRHTFTVGGAFFVGIFVAPLVVLGIHHLWGPRHGFTVPVTAALAGIAICYTIGEGIGRLACISFGCCYGKRLSQCSPFLRRLFGRWNFVFVGPTKKAAYEGRAEGEKLVPIQGVTAVLLSAAGLVGVWLFLMGWYAASLIFSVTATQVWRLLSEFLRADFRGFGRISPYQKMAIAAVPYVLIASIFLPSQTVAAGDIRAGLAALWDPFPILFLQGIWLAIFVFMGRSSVTTATVSLRVCKERI
jgi:hypothetical protein